MQVMRYLILTSVNLPYVKDVGSKPTPHVAANLSVGVWPPCWATLSFLVAVAGCKCTQRTTASVFYVLVRYFVVLDIHL